MKTVLFVPGFRENIDSRNYHGVIEAMKTKGYMTRFVPINWYKTTLPDWEKQLSGIYKNYDPAQTILAGFSFGALISLVVASKRLPSELWLFSLSPYFTDDLQYFKKSWLKDIGHRRESAFKTMEFNNLTAKITCKTIVMYGEIEAKKYPLLLNRSQKAQKELHNCAMYCVKMSDHDVGDSNYITKIKEVI